jgi:hypothetical protein
MDSTVLALADQRSGERLPAVRNRTRLEWWTKQKPHETSARLVNISEGGALLVAEEAPPLKQDVWLRLEEPTPTDWIKATVLRRGEPDETVLSFPEGCPYDFYMAAVFGFNLDGLLSPPVSEPASSLWLDD